MATNAAAKSSAKKATGKPRGPNKVTTAAEIKAQIEKAKEKLKQLEQKAYASELEEAIKKTSVVADFNAIKASASGATDLVILAAIGKACGIARLEISQKAAAKRASTKKKSGA